MLPDELRQRLRAVAAARGVSMATIVREAVEEKIEDPVRRPRSIGIVASGHSDTARRSTTTRPTPREWR